MIVVGYFMIGSVRHVLVVMTRGRHMVLNTRYFGSSQMIYGLKPLRI